MGISSWTRWEVLCDVPGCTGWEDDDPAETERSAVQRALDAGFVKQPDGRWLCPDHAGAASPRATLRSLLEPKP